MDSNTQQEPLSEDKSVIKLTFTHSQRGLKTAIRRQLAMDNILFEKVPKGNGDIHTEVHLPKEAYANYTNLLAYALKEFGPVSIAQQSIQNCKPADCAIRPFHRARSSCLDRADSRESIVDQAKSVIGGLAEDAQSSSSCAVAVAKVINRLTATNTITVHCFGENAPSPEKLQVKSTNLKAFKLAAEKLFPDRFGHPTCNYVRYAFDLKNVAQGISLHSSELLNVTEVLVVGSRDIDYFMGSYPGAKSQIRDDASTVPDSAQQTLQKTCRPGPSEAVQIEKEKTRQAKEKTKQAEIKEKTKQAAIKEKEKTKQAAIKEKEKTKQDAINVIGKVPNLTAEQLQVFLKLFNDMGVYDADKK
jgi:hypothetical protein